MLNVIDLFCGCGGLSEGFRLAGYNIVGGVDFNESAIKTYNRNFVGAKGICCDLLEMDQEQIQKEFGDLKDIDVIIGGPPCQGFSSANRYKTEGEDPRNKLFFEFVKFVDLAKPKAVVIENVRGIITSNNGYAKDRIYEIFESRGYTVNHRILDASEYGVPQKRQRNFFVMIKGDTKFDFNKVVRSDKEISVFEAIGELYDFESNDTNEPFYLNTVPDTEYRQFLRAKDNGIANHEVSSSKLTAGQTYNLSALIMLGDDYVITGSQSFSAYTAGVDEADPAAFGPTQASNPISAWGPKSGSGGGDIPEPTSGLLLLVGAGMLALRRKQK